MRIGSIPARPLACSPYLLALAGTLLPSVCLADVADAERWNAHVQATYIRQDMPPFAADYSGANSLSPDGQLGYSFTATAMLGWRPWADGEVYFDPEMSQGVALSNLTGLGGFTNGENARTTGPTPTFYQARLFLRQTWNRGGAQQTLTDDANQLPVTVDTKRWVLTVGNFSALDIFDNNTYSHDPRTQFLNWSLMTNGAYDYAADARGYSWGTTLEWYHDAWVVRAGSFAQPEQPNQQSLDPHIFQHYGDQIEVEHDHQLAGQPGKLRLLMFRNRAVMSTYADALTLAAQTGDTPNLNAVRTDDHLKQGVGLNIEQAIGKDVGVFCRAGWADGKTETYAFTEIDQSVSGGALIAGSAWGRGSDSLGIAVARNALSRGHRDYLAAGGMGFFLGDGQLNYRPEVVFEAFYDLALAKDLWLSPDWQHIRDPAYNADRGPVNVASLRLHTEF